MARISKILSLILGVLAIESAAQNITSNGTLTLSEVNTQVNNYLQLIQNGSITGRGISSRSTPLSGCALAVSLVILSCLQL